MDAHQSARDETYRRFLALLDQTFPGRLTINLHDAARFLTEHVGVPTSTEMARVYAKSGRLIPGLRKSPAATWLFPLPALAAGLADGFLGTTEPIPESIRLTALAKRDAAAKVAPRRGGRPRRSALSFLATDGWVIDIGQEQEQSWCWDVANLAPAFLIDYNPEAAVTAKNRLAQTRSQCAWEALAEFVDLLDRTTRAQQRLADLTERPSLPGVGRKHA
ncbi:hypothetical protein [Luteibacter sp. 9135]|uniref:hypothetical protein n=1 Tax=Luteibacter sp. 9135 TaxID=1500893 RepID=UPI00055F102B|nr:hypothetical protein [Luteibacter sp. 9135]